MRLLVLACFLLVATPAFGQSAEPAPEPAPAPESGGDGGIGDADLQGLGGTAQPESQPQNTNQQISREEAIEKIIAACKQNPQMAGCVKLRRACEEKRGAWQNDMARICPEVVGGGNASPAPRQKDISAADRDKVVRGCRQRPGLEGCQKLRRLCGQAYSQLGPNSQSMCRQMGWAGGGGGGGGAPDKPMAMHTSYAVTYLQVLDDAKVKGNSSVIGGHVSGRGFSTDGPYAAVFDVTIGKADTGWLWDFSVQAGLGGWINNRLAIGVTGGIRGSGITGGGLGTAWGVPVEVNVQSAITRSMTLMAYARPVWHLGDASGRKRKATIAAFADNFEMGAHVVFAKLRSARQGETFGLMAGLVYHEFADTQYVGARVGFGFATRE